MKLKEVQSVAQLDPQGRAMQMLKLGQELYDSKKGKGKASKLALPSSMKAEVVMDEPCSLVLKSLHGVDGETPHDMVGLSLTGRSLETVNGTVPDLVMTPQGRKKQALKALTRKGASSLSDLAIRQLGVGMLDSHPHARLCSAYAYWQATGLSEPVIPVLASAIGSDDVDEHTLAAMCLARIDPSKVKHLEQTSRVAKKQTVSAGTSGAAGEKASMTLIIHGTFANGSAWYKPGGDFHKYIRKNVYSDVYSGSDFYTWSGSYSVFDSELKKIWAKAARKLVAWCNNHPAKKLRLIAHSHGNNVVNMATQMGLKACSLIQLSPPVHEWNLPVMSNVASDRLFNIHSSHDPVVFVDGGAQDYNGTVVHSSERTRIISFFSHSDSHDAGLWKKKKIPPFVKTVCQ